jgi:hypothetical protein
MAMASGLNLGGGGAVGVACMIFCLSFQNSKGHVLSTNMRIILLILLSIIFVYANFLDGLKSTLFPLKEKKEGVLYWREMPYSTSEPRHYGEAEFVDAEFEAQGFELTESEGSIVFIYVDQYQNL